MSNVFEDGVDVVVHVVVVPFNRVDIVSIAVNFMFKTEDEMATISSEVSISRIDVMLRIVIIVSHKSF